jgi:hypothetical protein
VKSEVLAFGSPHYSRAYSIPGETAQVCLESDCGAVFALDGASTVCPRCSSDTSVSLWKLLNAIALAKATPTTREKKRRRT